MARTAAATLRKKQLRALELLRAGCTYDEIAHDLGYANRGSAWHLLRGAMDKQVLESVDEYRQLEMDRLDALQARYWDAALDGDRQAAALVLRVIDRRCRLLGLDREPKTGAPAGRTIYDLPDGYATKRSNGPADSPRCDDQDRRAA
jgi:hypothetical protein